MCYSCLVLCITVFSGPAEASRKLFSRRVDTRNLMNIGYLACIINRCHVNCLTGMLYCIEYLQANLDWLKEKLQPLADSEQESGTASNHQQPSCQSLLTGFGAISTCTHRNCRVSCSSNALCCHHQPLSPLYAACSSFPPDGLQATCTSWWTAQVRQSSSRSMHSSSRWAAGTSSGATPSFLCHLLWLLLQTTAGHTVIISRQLHFTAGPVTLTWFCLAGMCWSRWCRC